MTVVMIPRIKRSDLRSLGSDTINGAMSSPMADPKGLEIAIIIVDVVRKLVRSNPRVPAEPRRALGIGTELAPGDLVGFEHELNVKVELRTHIQANELTQGAKTRSLR